LFVCFFLYFFFLYFFVCLFGFFFFGMFIHLFIFCCFFFLLDKLFHKKQSPLQYIHTHSAWSIEIIESIFFITINYKKGICTGQKNVDVLLNQLSQFTGVIPTLLIRIGWVLHRQGMLPPSHLIPSCIQRSVFAPFSNLYFLQDL
jgi:hypothetical protein